MENEGWRVRKDGSRFWADVVITAVRDETGKHVGFSKVTRDLTAKQKAEEELRQSEERFRLLVESVKDYAIFMLDPSGNVATWNAGAAADQGLRRRGDHRQALLRFYPPEDVASGKTERELADRARHRQVRGGGLAHSQGRLALLGERRPRAAARPERQAARVREGHPRSDRAARGRCGAAPAGAGAGGDPPSRRVPLDRLARAQDAAHRGPASIPEPAQGLAEHDEKVRQRAERAYKGGERLADLVETLLDVSRIATGGISLIYSRFDLVQAAKDVVERFQEQANQSGCEIALRAEGPVIGEWDRLRVEQIFTNLISNAIKYAAGSRVDIRVGARGDATVFSVEDQGPGHPRGGLGAGLRAVRARSLDSTLWRHGPGAVRRTPDRARRTAGRLRSRPCNPRARASS